LGALVNNSIQKTRKDRIVVIVEDSNKVPLELLRKVLKMDKKTYQTGMAPWAKRFGHSIQGDLLMIPKERVGKFIEMLMWEKPFETKSVDE
jgi:hypothetical protein